jgi:hypothetical protein
MRALSACLSAHQTVNTFLNDLLKKAWSFAQDGPQGSEIA